MRRTVFFHPGSGILGRFLARRATPRIEVKSARVFTVVSAAATRYLQAFRMFSFHQPTDVEIESLIARQAGASWSYDDLQATRDGSPPRRKGWITDRHRVQLGAGQAAFEAAAEAIRTWRMFPPEMTRVYWPTLEATPGTVVAVRYFARPFRVWMVFPARVVYTIDDEVESERGPARRFGFAYGTLPDHPERGEERFLVEWNRADDQVEYELLAYSRPAHWLARLGFWYARYEQARFRRLSGLAMQRAVAESLAAANRFNEETLSDAH
jgi:uncharacterized protein (UPF0548 family)